MKILGKAGTLIFLEKKQHKYNYIIPPLLKFSKKFYYKNKEKISNDVFKKFFKKKIIIRSSSKNEDNLNQSNAGKYDSYQINDLSIFNIQKYSDEVFKKLNNDDEIIFQEYIYKPDYAGVIFTREINSNAPYYSINLDSSGKTDTITSGASGTQIKNIIICRNYTHKSKYRKLLTTVKNIEYLINDNRLDIEFCVKNKKIFIVQCRPLKRVSGKIDDKLVYSALKNIEKKFSNLQNSPVTIPGKFTAFSNMSDWNPAEMIGIKPSLLSLSIYAELITDNVWSEQRKNYLYQNLKPNPLMVNFLGCPYIDLRVDINSFLPNDLKKPTKIKIINHLINKINANPELHDKIEFDLIETFFDFDSRSKIKKYLNKKDTSEYIRSLKKLTNNFLNSKLLDKEINKIKSLKIKQDDIISSKRNNIESIFFLINDCKEFGTLPFAGIARCAFVATKILRTFVKDNIIDQVDYNLFFESINNVQKSINNTLLKNKNKKFFFKNFGHLRPMTYSISSQNYKEGFKNYFNTKNLKFKKTKKFKINQKKIDKINKIFKQNNINCTANNFFKFAKNAIFYREHAKLVFSKSIDLVFNELIKLGSKIDIKRNDLEHISIKDIINYYNNVDVYKLKKIIKNNITQNKLQYKITKKLEIPDFIKSKDDFYEFEKSVVKPNYVESKEITGKIVELTSLKKLKEKDLKNKIILLDSADPGYDFIFSFKILGLITKYGGANSHMSIRCIDEGIPAAIGVGDLLYTELQNADTLNLNSKQKTLNIIN